MKINDQQKYRLLMALFASVIAVMLVSVAAIPKRDSPGYIKVKEEFYKINAIPEADLYHMTFGDKFISSHISGLYVTDLSEEEIIKYYEQELGNNGWKFVDKKNQ